MLNFLSKPVSQLSGTIQVPGDKSISHRALMLGSIAKGITEIRGLLMGADNLATLEILRKLGVKIDQLGEGHFRIHGVGMHLPGKDGVILNCGNSGTAMRLLAGLLAGQNFDSKLTGDHSLSKRPMGRVVKPLEKMGAKITLRPEGTAPLEISGGHSLRGIRFEMPVASAQVKSCLLLAGLMASGETEIIESGPSRDHTERMLRAFGANISVADNHIILKPGAELIGHSIDIPGDISSAAFFMVAASIIPNSEILLTNVGINPTRDGVISILKRMGANITIENQRVIGDEPVGNIRVRSAELFGIEIPVDLVPLAIDEFPIIFIAAACAKGKTVLRGAEELRVKETDRILAIAKGLENLGIFVEVLEDGLIIKGGEFHAGEINSFDDHRIAMAFAIAGSVATGPVKIHQTENVATSFPNFLKLAKSLGLNISEFLSD